MIMSRKIRVVIIDDQELFRIGVRGGLGTNGRIEIVAEGTTEADALRLTNAHHPDVLLLGLNALGHPGPSSPNLSVFDTIRRLVKVGQTNVLVLSRVAEKGLVHSLLQAGASGFMLKDEAMNSCEVLEKAIESLAGKRKLPLTPSLYKKLFLHEPEVDDTPQLTRRRIEMMQAIADNPHLTLAEVAKLMGIAESTLRNNLSAISRTLETPSVSGSMIECLRLGVVKISC
jgi:two-component system response regulator DegU